MSAGTTPRTRRVAGILAAVLALTLVAPLVPALFGVRLLVVDGGSMEPTYRVGDVLAVTDPTGDDLVLDAPVLVGEGDARYVHRVIAVDGDEARLRGDANEVTDPGWVTQSEVTGVIAAHIPAPAATVIAAATSLEGRIALVLLLALAFGVLALRPAPAPAPAREEVHA